MNRDTAKNNASKNIVLKQPFYRNISKAFVPILAAAVIVSSAVLLAFSPENAPAGLFKQGLVRIAVSVFVLVFSIIPFFKKNYYIITSAKIMQYNGWEIYFKDIETVELHKRFFKISIEITPKQNPDVKFAINQWDIDQKADIVAKEISNRIKKHAL